MRNYITGLTVDDVEFVRERIKTFNPHILRAYDHIGSNQKIHDLIISKNSYKTLVADSGTYVLNELGKRDNADDYFNIWKGFLYKHAKDFEFYFNFDINFNGVLSFEENKKYQEQLESEGFNPVFVIHSFDEKEIKYVLDKNYEYVAIASAVLKNDDDFKKVVPYVKLFYDNGIKVHLLGCASLKHLIEAKYAWSCDASSYGRWASFNKVIYISKIKKKEVVLSIHEKNSEDEYNLDYIYDEKNELLKSIIEKVTYLKTEKSIKKSSDPTNFEIHIYPKIPKLGSILEYPLLCLY